MLTILGGGPSGLAAAADAARRGYPRQLFEAAPFVGGNCTTFQWRGFRYDSGAHRFHDRDPVVTARIQQLLGDELRLVQAPSQICTRDGFVTFPLQASTLPLQLGVRELAVAGWDYLRRPRGDGAPRHFEELAVRAYGRRLADRFLLGYSEKLWGLPCDRLSPEIAGRRLKGLNAAALLPRLGRHASHLEGAFYYPDRGYGRICERLADEAGPEHIHTSSPVTQLFHRGRRITRVELGHHTMVDVSAVCSTLPVGLALRLLRPAPDDALLETASTLRFRSVILVALFLNRPSVTPSASLYFPDPAVPFTRVVEPRNRSAAMAPEGQTSLIAEIPCFLNDDQWVATNEALVEQVMSGLAGYGLVSAADVLGSEVRRISHAYPVLEAGTEEKVRRVIGYFDRFENLVVTGRNGRFTYRHLHDMVRFGVEAVDRLEATGALSRRASSRAHGRIAEPAARAAR